MQFSGIRLACQSNRANHLALLSLNPAAQVGQCAALADKVINQQILTVPFHLTRKTSLPGKAAIAAGPCVGHDVGLYNRGFKRELKVFAQQFRQGARNGIHALLFVCVDTDQDRKTVFADRGDQFLDRCNPRFVDQTFDQSPCRNRIARLRLGIPGMPLDCHLAGQQDDIWKCYPCCPWRVLRHRKLPYKARFTRSQDL